MYGSVFSLASVLFWSSADDVPLLAHFRGGGIEYLNDSDSYAGGGVMPLAGSPKSDRYPMRAGYEYKLSADVVMWDGAHKSCEELGGYTLADPSIISQISFAGNLTEGGPYWTSNYYMKTDFYWKLGCYTLESQMRSLPEPLGNKNSLSACANDCENPEYIGLEENNCHCFDARPSLGRQSDRQCSTECPGDIRDTCGDKNKVSIYRMLKSKADGITIDSVTNDCVSVTKEDEEDYNYEDYVEFNPITASPCSQLKGYICESSKPDKVTGNIYYPFEEKVSWFEADRNCIVSGKKLAFIDGSNADGLMSRDEIIPGSSYWIGLYRQKFVIAGHFKISVKPYMCQVLDSTEERIALSEENCDTKRRSLCQKELPDRTTIQDLDVEPTMSEMAQMTEETSTQGSHANNAPGDAICECRLTLFLLQALSLLVVSMTT